MASLSPVYICAQDARSFLIAMCDHGDQGRLVRKEKWRRCGSGEVPNCGREERRK